MTKQELIKKLFTEGKITIDEVIILSGTDTQGVFIQPQYILEPAMPAAPAWPSVPQYPVGPNWPYSPVWCQPLIIDPNTKVGTTN